MTPILLAIACLICVTLCYVAVCVGSPFGDCRKCRGIGRHLKYDRKGRPKPGKVCRRCRGIGKRIRVGLWLYHRLARIHRNGTR